MKFRNWGGDGDVKEKLVTGSGQLSFMKDSFKSVAKKGLVLIDRETSNELLLKFAG